MRLPGGRGRGPAGPPPGPMGPGGAGPMGPPPGPMPGKMPGADPIRAGASMLNAPDLALAATDMQTQGVPTVREFLESKGVDIEGPVNGPQGLLQFAKKQMDTATPMGKAGMPPAGPGPPMGGAGPPPGPPPGMEKLLQGV